MLLTARPQLAPGASTARRGPWHCWQLNRRAAQLRLPARAAPGPPSPDYSLAIEVQREELERLIPLEHASAGDGPPSYPSLGGPNRPGSGGEVAPAAVDSSDSWWRRVLPASVSDRTFGLICMNIAVILYGSNWTVVKETGMSGDPWVFSSLRFLVAAAAFSPFLFQAAKNSKIIRAGGELGLWTGLGYLLQSEGLLTTDAARASFLSTFTVIIVPILAGVSGRGVRSLTWLAAVAALAGVSLLEGDVSTPVIGDVWSFLSAIAFGVQVFRTEHWARTLGPKCALPLTAVMLATTCACSLAATAAAHPAAAAELVQQPFAALQQLLAGDLPWQAALYTGLLTTDVCLLVEVVALQLISSTDAAIIFAMEPVMGAAFAYVLLGERWGPLGWAGAGLIISSSLATQLFGGEDEEQPVLQGGPHKPRSD